MQPPFDFIILFEAPPAFAAGTHLGNPVKTLLTMMRIFHYVVGITAPDKKHEKQILIVWIGVFVSLVLLALLFTRFIISELIR